MKNISVSLRLTTWFSIIFLAGFVLFGVAMWADLAYSLSQGRDRTLSRRAARIVDLLKSSRNDPPKRRQHRFEELTEAIPEGSLIRVHDSAGKLLFPDVPNRPDFPWPIQIDARESWISVRFGDRPFRVLTSPSIFGGQELRVVVAGQLEDNRNMMARFITGLAWATPLMLAISAMGGYFLTRRALQPVDQFTVALRTITIGNLSRRLPISNSGDELQRLAETCNDMLARLESAVERIHRFTADASHELRSPLALIRTVAEYGLRNQEIDRESREAFEDILAESVEAGSLLEDMLTLARADEGHADALFEPLALGGLVSEVCERMRPLAEAQCHNLTMRISTDPNHPARVLGDRSSLRRLVYILVDNAIKYTPAGGSIEVELTETPAEVTVAVRDNGIGIPRELLPRIFDRFVRADPSRGEVTGTGLGLAIAKWIAATHRATLTASSRESAGSEFVVRFKPAPAIGLDGIASPLQHSRKA